MAGFVRRFVSNMRGGGAHPSGPHGSLGSEGSQAGVGIGPNAGLSPDGVALAERWVQAKANKAFMLGLCRGLNNVVLVTGKHTTASRTVAKSCATHAQAARERRAATSDAALAYSQAREETDGFRARYAAAQAAASASLREAAAGRQYQHAKEQRKRVEQLRADLTSWQQTLRQKHERLRIIGTASRESAEVEAKAHVAQQRVAELTRTLASVESDAARAVAEVLEVQETALLSGLTALAESEATFHQHCATTFSNIASAFKSQTPNAGGQSRFEMLTAYDSALQPASFGGHAMVASPAPPLPSPAPPAQTRLRGASTATQPPPLPHPTVLHPRVLARADRNYAPRSASELALERGSYVVVRKDTGDHGWLQGEGFGEIGWFPSSHVSLIGQIPE
ncbi:SH3 domain-containing protein [Pseudoscourfieldia marina]